MKNPGPQFPFIINNYEQKVSASYLEKIVSLNEESVKKISALMTKIGFLESSIDDFIERNESKTDMEAFFKGLIPSIDSLDSIRRAVEDSGEEEWKKGVSIFYEKLLKLFSQFGFKPSAHAGMAFDSMLHETVGSESSSMLPQNTITEVVENGWLYKKKVVRFAKVVIAKEG